MASDGLAWLVSFSALINGLAMGCGRDQPAAASPTVDAPPPPAASSQPAPAASNQPPSESGFTLVVPTRLRIERLEKQARVSVDRTVTQSVVLEKAPSPNRVYGIKSRWDTGSLGLRDCPSLGIDCFDLGESFLDAKQAPSGKRISVKLTVFETDVPSQHHWMPESPAYREIWSGTIEGDVP